MPPPQIVLFGVNSYDPGGRTGDVHASEAVGGDCQMTLTAIAVALVYALALGADEAQVWPLAVESFTRSPVRFRSIIPEGGLVVCMHNHGSEPLSARGWPRSARSTRRAGRWWIACTGARRRCVYRVGFGRTLLSSRRSKARTESSYRNTRSDAPTRTFESRDF